VRSRFCDPSTAFFARVSCCGVYGSAVRRFKDPTVRDLSLIISPMDVGFFGRRRDASKRRRRLKFHVEIGATPDIRILVRRRSLSTDINRLRQRSHYLLSFGFRKDFSIRFAGLLTSLAVEKDRKNLSCCAGERPFYSRLVTRAGVFGNYSHRAAVKSERFGSARGGFGVPNAGSRPPVSAPDGSLSIVASRCPVVR